MINKESRFRVIGGETASFNIGDVIRPVKFINEKWMIGHNYRQALPFNKLDDGTYECVSDVSGKLLAKLERIK